MLELSARPVPLRTLTGPGRRQNPAVARARLPLYAGYADYLVRTRVCVDYADSRGRCRRAPVLKTAMAAAALVRHLIYADQELVVVLSLDAKSRLVAIHEAATGETRQVSARIAHVIKVPVLAGAFKTILVHNHPSGATAPSKADLLFYKKASAAFDLVGSRLVDSVIVGREGVYSLRWGVGSVWSRADARLVTPYPLPGQE